MLIAVIIVGVLFILFSVSGGNGSTSSNDTVQVSPVLQAIADHKAEVIKEITPDFLPGYVQAPVPTEYDPITLTSAEIQKLVDEYAGNVPAPSPVVESVPEVIEAPVSVFKKLPYKPGTPGYYDANGNFIYQ